MSPVNLFQASTVLTDIEDFLKRSEKGDAELFDQMFPDQVVYDHAENAWYLWRDNFWNEDKTGEVFGLLDRVAAEYLSAAAEARANGNKDLSESFTKRAQLLLSNKRMKSVLDIASRLPGIALTGDEWECNPMLLPVANGVIDLTTGAIRDGKPADYIRTFCPVPWLGLTTSSPLWEKSLSEIFNDDKDLVSFVSRLFGYSITGETKEQKLPIFWGGGSNGKSIIMDTIMSVLGNDICFKTQADSLMEVRQGEGNNAKPFIAALRNKRIVFASETKEKQKLNTGMIKELTGDGQITARKLHENPITFKQTHKIILMTNHLPNIPDSSDYAIWRRILRVPFSVSFKEFPILPDERPLDINLLNKLKAEYPGILAWLVRGCLEWQKQGLNPPAIVTDSTENYRQSEDTTNEFITDCIRVIPNAQIGASELFDNYVSWCESNGDVPATKKAFGSKVTSKFGAAALGRVNGKVSKIYKGIAL